jgi:hypothetical protein
MAETDQSPRQVENKYTVHKLNPAEYEHLTGEQQINTNCLCWANVSMVLLGAAVRDDFVPMEKRRRYGLWGQNLPPAETWEQMNCARTVELGNYAFEYTQWSCRPESLQLTPEGKEAKQRAKLDLLTLVAELGKMYPEIQEKVENQIQAEKEAGDLY